MRLGAIVESTGPIPAELGIVEMARAAEAAGAHGLWVSDHLLMLDQETLDYPYQPDGRPSWSHSVDYYEAFVCCAMMAAVTERCRVGTAVLVLPQRNVLEVAKVAASLDRLSGGRLALGVGAGWYEAEMEALGYRHRTRGRRFDQMLAVLHDCWSGHPDAFDGDELTVPDHVILNPSPLTPGGPPLLVGGMSDPALSRAARLGDGWLALDWVDRLDADRLAERLEKLREWRDGDDRPFECVLKLHASPAQANEIEVALRAVLDLGWDEVMIEPPWPDGLEAVEERIARARASVDELAAT